MIKRKQATTNKLSRLFDSAQANLKANEEKIFFKHQDEATHKAHASSGINRLFADAEMPVASPGKMLVYANNTKISEVSLKPDAELILGRHALADVQLNGFCVGDFHAKVICTDDRIYIEDLGSKKGTFLQGHRLTAHKATELAHSSVVTVAGFELKFELNIPPKSSPGNAFITTELPDEPVTDIYAAQLLSNHPQIKPWPPAVSELTVVSVIDETQDTKTLRLAAAKPVLFHFQPGQFITLTLSIDGTELKRSYSLASSPSRPHVMEITVKRVPGGLVSNWLNDNIKTGDVLKIKGPFGKFSCFNYPASKILLLAAGSGIVPIMSMLRWLTDTGVDVDIKLLLSFRTPADIIYHKELDLLTARHANVSTRITLTSDAIKRKKWPGDLGRIKKPLVAGFIPDLTERQVFLCGPDGFMEQARKLLTRLKLPINQLHCESFTSVPLQGGELKKVDPAQLKNRTGQYQVRFAKSGLDAVTDGAESLLELAAIYGVHIDNECQSGSCGECMVKCLSGDAVMLAQSEIDERDKQAGWLYSCCAYPKSNVVLDI